jgi:hypothetical protein
MTTDIHDYCHPAEPSVLSPFQAPVEFILLPLNTVLEGKSYMLADERIQTDVHRNSKTFASSKQGHRSMVAVHLKLTTA